MKTTSEKPIILIDGSSYLYRAFHALPPLINSRGEPTGAIYGVVNMIRKLLTDYDPEYVAVIFDSKKPTFRHQLFPAYKAHRPVMPQELQQQIEPLHQLIKAMGLALLVVDGVEADDVIASLAMVGKRNGQKVLISTGDKDMAQLVNEQINLINTMSDVYFDAVMVQEKYGVKPGQIVDYLALMGDSSDNIPGVPKVGPKTAVKWLQQYGSLEKIVEHADEIGGKVGENLRDNLSQLPLSKELVTLKLELDLALELKDLQRRKPDKERLIELVKHLEFKKWLADLLHLEPEEKVRNLSYQTILSKEDFAQWLQILSAADAFAFDTETDSLDAISANLVGISFAVNAGEAAYVPLAHNYAGAPQQLELQFVLSRLKPILENPKIIKLGQNLKFDIEVLKNYEINVQGLGFDTMLESYIINSSSGRHDMDSLALKYLDVATTTFKQVAGSGKKQLNFNQIPLEQAAPYAAEDADIVLKLHEKMWPLIVADKDLQKVFQDIEMPLVKVLSQVERNGVTIDKDLLQQQSAALAKRIKVLEQQACQAAGEEFNLGSPKQLQEILYGKLKLPILKKTPKGQPSTAEAVLDELALNYPLPKIVLEYRSLAKLKSTYLDSLPLQINPRTHRVHTSYNQAVTTTGRLSSTNPNLQNIPVRSEEGRKIRQAFIATSGKKIIAADYSQIELRILAHLSQDKGLIKAFENGADIHAATAAEVFATNLDKVTAEQRRRAKAINFGLVYGMSAFGLAQQLNISREQAQQYIDIYFQRYPDVWNYLQETRKNAHKDGFVSTIFGRRLYVPDINANNYQRQAAAERAAVNAPMQGTAADIIKLAMIHLDTWLEKSELDIKMIMQVHDELVFEVADSDVPVALQEIKRQMEEAVSLSVPLELEIAVGDNWEEAH